MPRMWAVELLLTRSLCPPPGIHLPGHHTYTTTSAQCVRYMSKAAFVKDVSLGPEILSMWKFETDDPEAFIKGKEYFVFTAALMEFNMFAMDYMSADGISVMVISTRHGSSSSILKKKMKDRTRILVWRGCH